MSATEKPGVDSPTTEPSQAATDAMRRHYAHVLPCGFCSNTPTWCICIRGDIPLRRARAVVTSRHKQAVALAKLSRSIERRRAA